MSLFDGVEGLADDRGELIVGALVLARGEEIACCCRVLAVAVTALGEVKGTLRLGVSGRIMMCTIRI